MAEVTVHGERMAVEVAGEGPAIVLLHGIAGTGATWREIVPRLAERSTVIAPDLLGHGQSAKPRGDYSLGAYAAGVRDLLLTLGHERATVVGHSLGGGIAMQFAYQFPERCDRLVLVASGGLGREVHPVLRAATLPGSEWVIPWLASRWATGAGRRTGRLLGRVGVRPGPEVDELAASLASLGDAEARRAFLYTIRGIVDAGGQRVAATDRLYLTAGLATLLVWGERDAIIPVRHGRAAHAAMPGSWLEVFERAGHFPHRDDPDRFVEVLGRFVTETPAAPDDAGARLAALLRAGTAA